MTTTQAPGTITVSCPDYVKAGFRTREDAERWIAALNQCSHKHTITVAVV